MILLLCYMQGTTYWHGPEDTHENAHNDALCNNETWRRTNSVSTDREMDKRNFDTCPLRTVLFHFSQQKLVSMFPFLPSNTGFVLANWDRSETVLLLAQSLKCPQHPVHSLGALSHHVRKPDCQAGWRSDMERGPGRYEIKMRKFQPVDQSATPCRWQTCAWQRDYSALSFPTRSTQYRPDTRHPNGELSKMQNHTHKKRSCFDPLHWSGLLFSK